CATTCGSSECDGPEGSLTLRLQQQTPVRLRQSKESPSLRPNKPAREYPACIQEREDVMTRDFRGSLFAALAAFGFGAASVAGAAHAQQADMTFFVTSVGKGSGADLGGLDGADAHCAALAQTAGAKATNWRAYLSTALPGGDAGVNARDRIGKGPWQN